MQADCDKEGVNLKPPPKAVNEDDVALFVNPRDGLNPPDVASFSCFFAGSVLKKSVDPKVNPPVPALITTCGNAFIDSFLEMSAAAKMKHNSNMINTYLFQFLSFMNEANNS